MNKQVSFATLLYGLQLFSGKKARMKVIAALLLGLGSLSGIAQTDTVHVVFKTHLDVGFTDFAQNVVDKYLDVYIPKAIHTARILEKEERDKYIWTTGSWIIAEYLRKASPDEQKELESAIQDGLICWNAYPFTADHELLDASLFRFALSISNDLDRQFGKKTIAAKITDVPGETIAVVNILQEQGVRLLHIGVNPASTRPETPPVFLWEDPQGGEVVVIYDDDYGGTIRIPGFNHILHFDFTGDNKGSYTPEEVKSFYREMEQKFPGAVILASSLNNVANLFWQLRDRLPVINAEIGNTWIHSAGTDPKKYAGFRALMRLRANWLEQKKADCDDPGFKEFSTYLLLLAEHTGGLDETSTLDHDHYTVEELANVLNTPPYQRMIQSWNDARGYVDKAVAALGDSPLANEARLELEKLDPEKPDLTGFSPFSMNRQIETDFFTVRFDTVTGAIRSLYDSQDQKIWNDGSIPVGLFWHESFSEEDYQHWADQYLKLRTDWAIGDFCKPNVGQHGAVSSRRFPKVSEAFIRNQKEGVTILMKLGLERTIPDPYGLPPEVWIRTEFSGKQKEIRYTVEWYDKKATRLPESYWFSMGFSTCKPANWKIEKINRLIAPSDVVSKGGRNLHGFNRGLFYQGGEQKLFIESLDSPVVAAGSTSLLNFDDQLPDLSKGWHFNLFNNKWGTNFPTWYSDDSKFRFVIYFD
jgi:hypothetical protein